MSTVLESLYQTFDPARIDAWVKNLAPKLILALITFGIFYATYRFLHSVIARVARRVGLEKTAAGFLLIVVKYALLIFGAITALQQVGINVTSVFAGLGIVGLSLGFAARDTLSNVIAGLFLFWDKPFVIGDLIEASDEYGEVREITLRTTRIVTPDGKMISIPNAVLVNNKIRSYTMEPHLRLDLDVAIGVNEEIGKVRDILLSLVRNDRRFLPSPRPVVVVTNLGDYYVGLQLRVWLDEVRDHIPVRAELRESIKNALDRAGVMMPYETFEVISRGETPARQEGLP